jgi:plasmid stabilization system protein ParE
VPDRPIRFERRALLDLNRIHQFLSTKNPRAANGAVSTVRDSIRSFHEHPELGRLFSDKSSTRRELLVPYARGGYAVLYELREEEIVILAIRHQLEAGY